MSDEPWYDDVVIPALLRHARPAYGTAMRRALAAAGHDGIPANGLYVLGGLALGRDNLPLADLIRELRISKQSATGLIDALVEQGYLERRTDAEDRRRLTIGLTERGRAAAAIQATARALVDAELLEQVGPDAVAQMRRALGALCGIAQRLTAQD